MVRTTWLVMVGCCLLPACGGGGGSGGQAATEMFTLLPIQERGGWVDSAGGLDSNGGHVVGDTAANVTRRAIVCFDLTTSPATGTITDAVLSMVWFALTGGLTTTFGDLIVEHIIPANNTLSAADYDSPPIATLGTFDTITSPLSVSVGNAILVDLLSGRSRSCFRIRFELDTDGDNRSESVSYTSAAVGSSPPRIAVTYTP